MGAGTVFTVGHSSRSPALLASLLRSAGVARLLDVRRWPGSRRHPHFDRDSLESALAEIGIDYRWLGRSLGGNGERREAHRLGEWARVEEGRLTYPALL